MEQFAAQSVADVHHRRRLDIGIPETLDDVATGLSPELSLQQIFLSGKVGFEMLQLVEQCLVSLALCLLHLLVIDALLSLQQLQSHICRAEVARHTHEVGLLCTVAIHDLVFCRLTYACDAYGESGI